MSMLMDDMARCLPPDDRANDPHSNGVVFPCTLAMLWTAFDVDADAADATDAPPENPRFCIRRLVANCCIDSTEASI